MIIKFDKDLLKRLGIFSTIISALVVIYNVFLKPKFETDIDFLEKSAREINAKAPIKTDSETVLEGAHFTFGGQDLKPTLVLTYSTPHLNSSNFSQQDLIQKVEPAIIQKACQQFKNIPKIQSDRLTFKYKGNDGKIIIETNIEYSQCITH
ncbi:hypothetical protein [Acinetobacter sp. MB5]|uniref:hypothetical protein n=1 Tax=Acinetobacter sp. MB5 TaxID=2069438 RepID=UPI000DD01142|nr:hypothetical protein [Acinetobacter sp. MB5]